MGSFIFILSPILILNSLGPSEKSQSMHSSSIKELHANSMRSSSLVRSNSLTPDLAASSIADTPSSEAISSVGELPPLKPPPGRTVPLPPPQAPPQEPPQAPPKAPPQAPPKAPAAPSAPCPPPPPRGAQPPPPLPPKSGPGRPLPSPPMSNQKKQSNSNEAEAASSKAKLKPFFWDKVLADPNSSMVWNEIKSGSFQ